MRTLTKRNRSFLPELPSLFDDFLSQDVLKNWTDNGSQSLPAVNVREADDSYELEVAAPGMNKKDFKVELDNNMLLISAEREEKQEDKGRTGDYTRREFHYQNFMRSFNLPENLVESDKISARYSEGILHITVPKSEHARAKPAKMIEIS